jgi:hypothetical protein
MALEGLTSHINKLHLLEVLCVSSSFLYSTPKYEDNRSMCGFAPFQKTQKPVYVVGRALEVSE